MVWSPSFRSVVRPGCDEPLYEVGHHLVDGFLEFVAARARPNTVLASDWLAGEYHRAAQAIEAQASIGTGR